MNSIMIPEQLIIAWAVISAIMLCVGILMLLRSVATTSKDYLLGGVLFTFFCWCWPVLALAGIFWVFNRKGSVATPIKRARPTREDYLKSDRYAEYAPKE